MANFQRYGLGYKFQPSRFNLYELLLRIAAKIAQRHLSRTA